MSKFAQKEKKITCSHFSVKVSKADHIVVGDIIGIIPDWKRSSERAGRGGWLVSTRRLLHGRINLSRLGNGFKKTKNVVYLKTENRMSNVPNTNHRCLK